MPDPEQETGIPGAPPLAPAPPPTPPAFPSLLQAILLVFILIALLTLIPVSLSGFLRLGGFEPTPLLLGILGNGLGFALILPSAALLTRRPLGQVFPLRRVPGSLWPPMAMVVLGWQVLAVRLDQLVERIWPVPERWVEFFQELIGPTGNPLPQLLLLVVVAPLTEELFFRGVLLQGFLRRYPAGAAVGASAALFALTHANPWQLLPTFVIGLYFGWWVARTGSLWPGIAGHALFNGVPWGVLQIQRLAHADPPAPAGDPLQPGFPDLAAGILLIAGTAILARRFRRGAVDSPTETQNPL